MNTTTRCPRCQHDLEPEHIGRGAHDPGITVAYCPTCNLTITTRRAPQPRPVEPRHRRDID